MMRQRALAWAAILALILAIQIAPLPIRLPSFIATALAQDTTVAEAGEPTDLAVVALHCAEAPAAEALASFFATGAPPAGCAPAVGVAVAVEENGTPLPGSPFTTDVTGALGVSVGLGSSVLVNEDPESLPAAYEPLSGEVNGVPYANPVRLDSAVAGAAVLFVNVPSNVAAELAQEATAAELADQTDLADDGEPDASTAARASAASPTREPEADRTSCDQAYADEPNSAVVSADLRALNADGDGMGSDPISASSGYLRGTPAVDGNFAGASDPVRIGNGPWGWQGRTGVRNVTSDRSGQSNLAVSGGLVRIGPGVWFWPSDGNRSPDWLWSSIRNRAGDWSLHGNGLWLWSGTAGSGTGNLAISGSSVRIRNGVWFLPSDRDHGNGWPWPRQISVGNLAIAQSGNGNLAVVSNPVRIGAGVWGWPDRDRVANWREDGIGPWDWTPGRGGARNWRMNGTGVWIGSGALARSGNGNLAVVGSAVRIGFGVWLLPPGRISHGVWAWPSLRRMDDRFWPRRVGSGGWVWSGALARSGNGNLAISGGLVRVGTGVWLLPPNRSHANDWLGNGGDAHAGRADVGPLMINGILAVEASPSKLEQPNTGEQPAPTSSDGPAVQPALADSVQPSSDSSAPPVDAVPPDSGGSAVPLADAAPSDAGDVDPSAVAPAVETPPDGAVLPSADPGAPDLGYVAPDLGYVDPDPGYVDPAAAPAVDAGYIDAATESSVDPGYVAPEPVYAEPSFVDPGNGDSGYAEPGFADPAVAPAIDAGFADSGADPGFVDPGNVAPNPGADPGIGDAGFVAADSGNDGPDFFAPDPGNVDAGGGQGFGDLGGAAPDPGFGVPDNAAPDPGFADPGNAGSGTIDAGGGAPDLDVGRNEQGREDG